MQQISQTRHGDKILKQLDEDDIKKKLQKERRELQAKLKSQEKNVDYLERAKRLEEIPLLVAHLKERELQEEAFWKQKKENRIRDAITERELAVGHHSRLLPMKPEKMIFLEKSLKDRNTIYENKLIEFEKLLADERKKRLAERRKLHIAKNVDYLERAKRLEEIPLLVAHLKERELRDKAFWKQEEEKRIRDSIPKRELAVGQSYLLHNMEPEKIIFLEKLLKGRNIIYENKLIEFEKLLADERKKRLAERRKLHIAKNVDYFERAKRIEEIPLLVVHWKERELQEEAFWKQDEENRIRDAITERELAVGLHSRLLPMKPEKMIFLEKLFKDRNIVYENKLKEFETLLAGERKKRLAERRKLRIEERRKTIEYEEGISRMRKEQEELKRSMATWRQRKYEIDRIFQKERSAHRKETSIKEVVSAWLSKIEVRPLEVPKRSAGASDLWKKGGALAEKAEEPKKVTEALRPTLPASQGDDRVGKGEKTKPLTNPLFHWN